MSTIKVAKTFRLSPEAVSILESQSNATQFIEDLIISSNTWVPEAESKAGLSKEEVLDLIKTYLPLGPSTPNNSTVFVPSPPDPITGYPCCQKKSPCKHWSFDGAESVWKNELTGKTMEVL
jgi:hypothetical protein